MRKSQSRFNQLRFQPSTASKSGYHVYPSPSKARPIGLSLLIALGFLIFGVLASKSEAADFQWNGLYRFEGLRINNPELNGQKADKAYMLHHLILAPKIIAADGMTIYGRFDLLNNGTFGANNQAGDFLGKGVGTATPTGSDTSNVLSKNQEVGGLAISQLYMNWNQEFGQLVVGRAPLNFGLGAWFNSGRGDYDHYFSTLDMVGYKIVMGNFYLMPILGKVNEGSVNQEDDVNDYIIHAQYDNPETDLSLGLLYQMRIGGGNDIPVNNSYVGGTGSTRTGNYKHNYIGLFSSQKISDVTVGVEAGLLSGDAGARTSAANGSQDVKFNGFGLASEINWQPADSKWAAKLMAGFASGDDPGTAETQEGMVFHRNYRLGMLMFRHPLGQRDFFRTGLARDATATYSALGTIDTEAISNVLYIAPKVTYKSSDKWSYAGTLITGRLNKEPIAGGNTGTNIGYEVDLAATWSPFDRFSWTTELGLLLPGDSWKAGSANLDNSFAYGLMTKAAVRF